MNTRKHVFATAAMALVAALAAGSAFAIASSGDHSANAQRDSTDQATYSSNQAMGSADQNAAPPGAIRSPGESSGQSSQTYGASDNTEPNDADAAADATAADDSNASQESMTPPDQETMGAPDEESTEPAPGASEGRQGDTHRMADSIADSVHKSGFTKVNLTTTDVEPSHATMGPAIETTDSATVEGSSITLGPGTATATNDRTVVAEPAIVTPTEPAIVAAPDEPMYTPETGDAQYGSKLEPERSMPPAAVEPPSRFNDATGQ